MAREEEEHHYHYLLPHRQYLAFHQRKSQHRDVVDAISSLRTRLRTVKRGKGRKLNLPPLSFTISRGLILTIKLSRSNLSGLETGVVGGSREAEKKKVNGKMGFTKFIMTLTSLVMDLTKAFADENTQVKIHSICGL